AFRGRGGRKGERIDAVAVDSEAAADAMLQPPERRAAAVAMLQGIGRRFGSAEAEIVDPLLLHAGGLADLAHQAAHLADVAFVADGNLLQRFHPVAVDLRAVAEDELAVRSRVNDVAVERLLRGFC